MGTSIHRRRLREPPGLRIAAGDPESVPAGRYARKALRDRGIWEEVRHRLVPCEDVRAALALVERGEADLGIVYATDAKASRRVRAEFHLAEGVARYPVVLIAEESEGPRKAFLDFLLSVRARAVFEEAGFRFLGGGE
jgi:molybdate transport system substrate-binding protein